MRYKKTGLLKNQDKFSGEKTAQKTFLEFSFRTKLVFVLFPQKRVYENSLITINVILIKIELYVNSTVLFTPIL